MGRQSGSCLPLKDNRKHAVKVSVVLLHIPDGNKRERNRPDPAHLGNPVVLPLEGVLLAKSLRILAVSKALGMLHATLRRRIVNGSCGLAPVVKPALVIQAKRIEPLRDHTTVGVAAPTRLAHVQRNVIGDLAMLAACSDVEVGGKHRRCHVAHLGADNVPRAGIELLLDTVSRELNHAPSHVLCLITIVSPYGTYPRLPVYEFRDVPFVVEGIEILLELTLGARARCAVHHVRGFADPRSPVLPVIAEDAHHLEDVRGERGNRSEAEGIRLLLGDHLPKRRLDTTMEINPLF